MVAKDDKKNRYLFHGGLVISDKVLELWVLSCLVVEVALAPSIGGLVAGRCKHARRC